MHRTRQNEVRPYRRDQMNRRSFIALGAAPLFAQSTGRLTNDDQHGMNMPRIAGVDAASQVVMARAAMPGQVQPVLTRSGGNLRHGSYLAETRLTPQSITQTPPRLLYTMTMPGDPRIEAQPLLVPSVTMSGGAVHDLCIMTLMSNHVAAFDANTGIELWSVQLGNPITGSTAIDAWKINPLWGILSTGVIDGTTLYCVAWISPNGTPAKAQHWLYAINVATGASVQPPLVFDQTSTIERKQRAALTLTNVNGVKTVFVAWGTIQETADGAHGFVTAVDLASWKITAEWSATKTGKGSGIWMAGQGPAVDDQGYLFLLTGNGDFDGVNNFGESFVKLYYDGKSIVPVDWFTPFLDSQRGTDAGWDDMDLGSGGIVVLPSPIGLVIGAGKDGIAYSLPWRKLGKTTQAQILNGTNYNALAGVEWFTYYNPATPTPMDSTALNQLFGDVTHHQHSTPVAWQSALHGMMLFCWGENGNLRAWTVSAATPKPTFLANGAAVASPNARIPPGGMPGGGLALSANGTQNGLLWALVPDGDANKGLTTGKLYCYDAQNFGVYQGGAGEINLLWQTNIPLHSKFNVPVISDGKIYVPTYSGQVMVFG